MSMESLLTEIRALDGVLELAPTEGDGTPPIAWGDHFFYYAPDGRLPERGQPFVTIVTKDYPSDDLSDLDPPGRWRLNVHVGAERFEELLGEPARPDPNSQGAHDFAAVDLVLPHPVYRAQGWVAIVTPGPASADLVSSLLRRAHTDAVRRWERRG